jgi:hypothetical protein
VIHEPIPTAGLSKEERFKLAERVRQAIASALPQPAAVTGEE